jgi:hypothetical protein
MACIILSFVPASVVLAVLEIWRRWQNLRGRRAPVSDKLLRAPGESARKQVEALDDKITETLFLVIYFPSILAILFAARMQSGQPFTRGWTISLVLVAGGFVYLLERLIALIKKRNDWRLAYGGERAVGEELNKLMLDGCQVFHDFPLNGDANLDHIVVAPSGVYAIETKTRRKRESSSTQKAHELIYDGAKLRFPTYWNSEALVQSRHQAEQLGRQLGEALKTPVPVKPILTFPGWYVIVKTPATSTCLIPK